MRTRLLLLTTIGLAVSTLSMNAQSISDFEWIVGTWTGELDGASISEVWSKPDDNTLSGSGYVVVGPDTVVAEQLLIRRIGDKIVYIATINDGDPILFTSRGRNDRGEYVFENPEHDFPQRIIYMPKGKKDLVTRIEGMADGEMQGEEYRYSRQ